MNVTPRASVPRLTRPACPVSNQGRFLDRSYGRRDRDDLRAFTGRVGNGPGGAGNTNRSLTRQIDSTDRRASHEGYPSTRHPAYGIHPMSGGADTARRGCPTPIQREMLRDQGYVCMYCAEPFGSVVRRTHLSVTQVNYDHAIPFAFLQSNPRSNWVASCNICNGIKSSGMFHSIQEIRAYVLEIREKRRHRLVWVPEVSSEEDPERWAISFATFLASLSFREGRQLEKTMPTPLGRALSKVEALNQAAIPRQAPRDVDLGGFIAYGSLNRGLWPWSA